MESYTLDGDTLEVRADGRPLRFQRVTLVFSGHGITDVFARKNNKTVEETLAHRRYAKLGDVIARHFAASMGEKLGNFLLALKRSGNPTYKRFLNQYGDAVYCGFRLEPGPFSSKKGLYCYCITGRPVYVGRSLDPFEKRINQGYGTIHPKNCYLDGQSPNCRLNALIGEHVAAISFYVCPLGDDADIIHLERRLIQILTPAWNIALK